ncbi:MAG: CCA tRNA nucleotidyltransferase [Patescibacteria group bacterium]|jgi:poly(A) polymerase
MEKWQKNLKIWQEKPFIKQLKNQLPQAEVFLVGGAVRDAILNRPTKDFDFVVRNVSKNDLEKFLTTQGKVSLVGKRFGVFKFRPRGWQGEEIDIALPRTEHSLNFSGAYKDFKIQSNAKLKIEDDLSRRDFTINAMAFEITRNYELRTGNKKVQSSKFKVQSQLVDPFHGLADLKHGIIRAVGKPELRFKEDYSRILRAIRFACQLNFTIEPKTWRAIKLEIKNLNKTIKGERVVPYEVIAKELIKALAKNPIWAIELLDQAGAIKVLTPELLKMKGCPQPKNFHSEGDCWQHTILSIKKLEGKEFKKEFKNPPLTPELIWGLLFHDLGKPYTIVKADRLRFNNHDTVSARKFKEIAEKLKLSSAGLDIEIVEKIIAKHMLPTHSKTSVMKDTTIEKYFFNPNFPGTELMMLIFADISATVPQSGKPDFTEYNVLKKRINKLRAKSKNKKELPKPLVTGADLIKELKLTPGPKFGTLLSLAREAQLKGKVKTKKQGLNYLKKFIKKEVLVKAKTTHQGTK